MLVHLWQVLNFCILFGVKYSVMILVLFFDKKQNGNKKCGYFSACYRQPDSIQPPDDRENKYRCGLKDKGSQEGNKGRDQTVIESGEEGGTINGKSGKEEGEGIDGKCVTGKLQKMGIITHKNLSQRYRKQFGQYKHDNGKDADQQKTFLSQIF